MRLNSIYEFQINRTFELFLIYEKLPSYKTVRVGSGFLIDREIACSFSHHSVVSIKLFQNFPVTETDEWARTGCFIEVVIGQAFLVEKEAGVNVSL